MGISKEQIKQYRDEQKTLRARRKEILSDTACTDKFISEYQTLCQTQIGHESLNYLRSLDALISSCSADEKSINIRKYVDDEKRLQQLKQDIYDAAMDAYSVGDYVDCKRFLDVVGDEGQLYSEIQGKVQEAERIRKAIIRRRVSLISCFSIMCVVVAVLLAIYVVIPHNILSKAQELSEMAQYTESINQYEDLKNYKQSKSINENSALYRFTFLPSDNSIDELIIETKYLRAIQALDKQDYDYALSEFQALGEYKDSQNKALESLYQKGKSIQTEGEYENAIDIFTTIMDYLDSETQIISCKDSLFKKGMDFYEKQLFNDSNAIFQYLNGYNDSLNYIHQHEYKHDSVRLESTCEGEGIEIVKCWCGDIKEQNIVATGHKYTSVISKQPTCTVEGVRLYICSVCGHSYNESIAKTQHNYTGSITTNPTCVKAGVRNYKCTICGKSYTEEVPAIGHNYSNSSTTLATCEKVGIKTYTCSNCGESYNETIPATGHKFTTADCTHDSHCTVCGYIKSSALGHTTSNGVCERCGLNTIRPISFSRIVSGYPWSVSHDVNFPKGIYRIHGTINIIPDGDAISNIRFDIYCDYTWNKYSEIATFSEYGEYSFDTILDETEIDGIHCMYGRGASYNYNITVEPVN